jgi:oligopeptide/dipeptide ABC transporter ATP-binding protein
MNANETILETRALTKEFPVRDDGFFSSFFSEQQHLRAVDEISIEINQGEIVGLAGQSGCGKSTLGELVLGLQTPTSGEILFNGAEINSMNKSEKKRFRRNAQMIFQDPYESLNPRFNVGKTVTEPLRIHGLGDAEQRDAKMKRALEDAGLRPPEKYISRLPNELSGGEKQRVAIARALVLDPDFIVADEPVSMLDVSVSTGILNQFKKLQKERDLTILYISHDLATIDYLTDRTLIMYLGDIVEQAATRSVINEPAHPYTEQLLSAVPNPDPERQRGGSELEGDVVDAVELPTGCRFHPHCKYATEECTESEPELEPTSEGHEVACYHPVSTTQDAVE